MDGTLSAVHALERFHRFWRRCLDALAAELARGKRERGAPNVMDQDPNIAPTDKENGDR